MICSVVGYFVSQDAFVLVAQMVRLARLDVASSTGCLFGNVLVCAFVPWHRIVWFSECSDDYLISVGFMQCFYC